MLETVQTALNGADVFYWFIAGFGDVERLAHSHFTPIDIAFLSAVTSLIVQGYFCYRIWILSRSWRKQSLWICWIIAAVCIPDPPCILQTSDVFLSAECSYAINRHSVGRCLSQLHGHVYRDVLSHAVFSRSRLGSMWFPRQLYMYAHQARLEWPYHLSLFETVMGYTECHGRRSHCGGNDYAGTITMGPSDL